MMKMNRTKKQNGFTLIEALVAISILLIAITTPMVIAQKGLTDAVLSRDEATASFLAQDGIEAVKNIRDTTALSVEAGNSVSNWLQGLAQCESPSYCNIDTKSLTVLPYPYNPPTQNDPSPIIVVRNSTGQFLYFGGLNVQSAGSPSIFSRKIIVSQPYLSTNPNEAEVTVVVSWNEPSGPQNATTTDFIYNYSPYL
jgi:prepilin-type N-terminal cleavage/methylation domain-containing protein